MTACYICKQEKYLPGHKGTYVAAAQLTCPETGRPICPRCYDEMRFKLLKEGVIACAEAGFSALINIEHLVLGNTDMANKRRKEMQAEAGNLIDLAERLKKYGERIDIKTELDKPVKPSTGGPPCEPPYPPGTRYGVAKRGNLK